MEKKLHLIFEDYSAVKRLKEGNILVWISLIVLGFLFIPIVLISLYFTFFGFFPYLTLPEYYRFIMCFAAVYIVNLFFVSMFGKPIKVYKEGVNLGTIGSLGWRKALFLGCVYYFQKTKFIPWNHIKTIQIEPSIKSARTLKITDTKGKIYYCRIEEKKGDKFYKKLTQAIKQAVQQEKIVDS